MKGALAEPQRVGQFRTQDSVGGTPTGAVETIALPKKLLSFTVVYGGDTHPELASSRAGTPQPAERTPRRTWQKLICESVESILHF